MVRVMRQNLGWVIPKMILTDGKEAADICRTIINTNQFILEKDRTRLSRTTIQWGSIVDEKRAGW